MSLIGALCSRQTLRLGKGIQQLKLSSSKWLTTSACLTSQTQPLNPDEGFWDKNKRLNRPMSPHLTIYKFQITSMLSITHRGTGLALSGLMSGFAIGMLALPHGFPHYYNLMAQCPAGAAMIVTAKFLIAFPFIFHLCNGVRHLAWDMGKGFQLKDLYMSGYTVLGTSVLLSVLAAAM